MSGKKKGAKKPEVNNYVAKHAHEFNKSSVMTDRTKKLPRDEKHKGKKYE